MVKPLTYEADTMRFEIRSKIISSETFISSKSVFGDSVWDRREYAESRMSWKGAQIHWKYLFDRFSESHLTLLVSIKEFAYALLFDPIEEDFQKDTKSVINIVSCLGTFIEYLQQQNFYNLSELEHRHIDEYLTWLFVKRENSQRKRAGTEHSALVWAGLRIGAIQLYHRYSKRVSEPIPICPLQGKGIFTHFKKRRRNGEENTTPVIPKNIWDIYLCAALDYVQIYSPDILRAQAIIEKIRSEVLPLHINKTGFNTSKFRHECVESALLNMPAEFAINPQTGKPWRSGWPNSKEFFRETRALYDACLIVIGCLSGMRETELSLIKIDGFWSERINDSVENRFRILSLLTKGDRQEECQWEVNEPVFHACNIVKELTAYARMHVDYDVLFIQAWDISPTLQFSAEVKKASNGKNYGKTAILPVGPNSFTRYLRRFAAHLSSALEGQYKLPLVDGEPWNFVMRMLRRSLAGRIAREPFGTIAGMLHYKHVKITTFLGYAGSDPNWLHDLHDEEIAASEEFLTEIWEDLQEDALAGAKGEELIREFKGIAGGLRNNSLKYFLESHRANLHVGLLNYCIFQKDRALCLNENAKSGLDTPILNFCHPDRCANSCITSVHLPKWEVQVADAQAMLSHKTVTIAQKVALSRDLEKALRIVNRLKV